MESRGIQEINERSVRVQFGEVQSGGNGGSAGLLNDLVDDLLSDDLLTDDLGGADDLLTDDLGGADDLLTDDLDNTAQVISFNTEESQVSNDLVESDDLLSNESVSMSSPTIKLFEMTSDDEQGISMSLDTLFDPELVEELNDDDDDGDFAEIQEMISSLENKGYVVKPDISYEELTALLERENLIVDCETKGLNQKGYKDYLRMIVDNLKHSKATQFTNSISTLDSLDNRLKPKQVPAGLSQNLADIIWKYISTYLRENPDDVIDADDVLQYLENVLGHTETDLSSDVYRLKVRSYIETLIPICIATIKSLNSREILHNQARDNTSNRLLKDEIDFIKLLDNHDFTIIRQIVKVGNDYMVKCPQCGKLTSLGDYLCRVVIFTSERARTYGEGKIASNEFYYLGATPVDYFCDCGQHFCFAMFEFAKLRNFFYKEMRKNLRNFSNVLDTSKGTSFSVMKMPIKYVEQIFEDIIYEDSSITTEIDNDVMEIVTEHKLEVVDDKEFRQAVKYFYDNLESLQLFDSSVINSGSESNTEVYSVAEDNVYNAVKRNVNHTSSDDHISYKELAIYFSSMLSEDYNQLKNKAIFTLLSTFSENQVVKKIINRSTKWDLENATQHLNSISDLTITNKENRSDLLVVYSLCKKAKLVECSFNKFTENHSLVHDSLAKLRTKVNDYNEQEVHIDELYNGLKQQLLEHEEALGYTKLINITQIPLKDFTTVICSPELLGIFDRISDRMIVNNLLEDYYNILRQTDIIKSKPLKTLETAIGKSKFNDDWFSKLMEAASTSCCVSLPSINKYMQNLDEFSALPLENLANVQIAFNSNNFYTFVKEAYKLDVERTLISPDLDKELSDFKMTIKEYVESRGLQKLFEKKEGASLFYFRDFTEEEVVDNIYEFSDVYLDNYVLKRNENESVSDYLERFSSLASTNSLNKENSYSIGEMFHEFSNYFIFLFCAANVYNLNFRDFMTSTFTDGWIRYAVDALSRDVAIKLLGIKKSVLTLLLKDNNVLKYSSDEYEISELNYKLISNVYSPYLDKFMNEKRIEYDRINLSISEDTASFLHKFSIIEYLDDYLSNLSNYNGKYYTLDDGDSAEHLEEDLKNEIMVYGEFSKILSNRFYA